MSNKLDFLVIGAQKCATTWLYECLKEHPQICLPADKKEVEYLGGKIYLERGADWYFSLVNEAQQGQLRGDVSVEYMWDPKSPAVVKEFLPNVKMIASLRNPAERAISAYYWYLRKGLLPANHSIKQTFEQLRTSYLEGQLSEPGIDIILRGFYDVQLSRYLQIFSPSQLLVFLYEDIKEHPIEVLRQIFRFIGISEEFIPDSLNERPKQNSQSKLIMRFERMAPKSKIIAAISNKLNQFLSGLGKEKIRSKEELDAIEILIPLFETSVNGTFELIKSLPAENQPLQKNILSVWNKK
ncbi:sulfotransferase domain-containing protein [Panacibacter sp. DH6]|uniref:Sulfotransferase domain-containing protein n=1 Tax=Panacibacter microcysteis TaxID=2793269 RepID=A0A931GXE2_9BACT|nr:sulfotransferase domain-containing protein [Panacibacter microcysteis]MBG9375479.1 sulfotransferase domain-containing protein [Panacibacter microcysteis]